MLNCDQALELISAKVDDALTAEDSAELDEHLAACAACRALLADFEQLHEELPPLAAQPPAGLKDAVMAEVRRSKVTPFQGKKTQWRWRSLASLAAVLVLVVVGSNALRQWDGSLSQTAQAPAAAEPAAADSQALTGAAEAGGRILEGAGGDAARNTDSAVQEKQENSTSPAAPTSVPETVPAGEPSTYSVQPECREIPDGLTADEALKKLALYLGWAEDSLTADSSGTLTGPGDDGIARTITCAGLNADGTGWVCQVEERSPGPDGTASCTTYTVPLDGSEITQP